MTKRRMSDESEFVYDDNGKLIRIIPPVHLRPDIAMGEPWYKEMMVEIRGQLKQAFDTRTPPVPMTDAELNEIAMHINEVASSMADIQNDSNGKPGRPRNIGSEIAAAGVQKIGRDFSLPACGNWEDSLTADLLSITERASRQYKDRMEPVSGNRKARLIQGYEWTITD